MKAMNPSGPPDNKRPRTIPRGVAYVLFAFVWGVIPWAVSLIGPRFGWTAGRPGLLNGLGLLPLAVGLAGSIWTMGQHITESGRGLDFEPEKDYLLTRGAYAFSRNPMYLAELVLLLGWAFFYGSISVFSLFLVWCIWFHFFQVPQEERTIRAHFGETYLEYQRRVRRWWGRR